MLDMQIRESFKKLKRCRVRAQRVRDGKIFSGRLDSISNVEATMRLEGSQSLLPGDEISVEIHGPMMKVLHRARVKVNSKNRITVEVLGEMRSTKTTESARIDVEDVMAKVHFDDMVMIASVFDVSREGLAIKLSDAVPPGKMLQIDFQYDNITVQLYGVVRYCRELNDGLGHTRIGIQLHHKSRLTSAKWFTYFDKVLESA